LRIARGPCEGALGAIGYGEEDSRIVTDQLIENSLCGYRFADRCYLVVSRIRILLHGTRPVR
jgi:hypothetical protein